MLSAWTVAAFALHTGEGIGEGSADEAAFFAEADGVAADAVWIATLADCFERHQRVGVKRFVPVLVNAGVALTASLCTHVFSGQAAVAASGWIVDGAAAEGTHGAGDSHATGEGKNAAKSHQRRSIPPRRVLSHDSHSFSRLFDSSEGTCRSTSS
jgi:hypothetical protein